MELKFTYTNSSNETYHYDNDITLGQITEQNKSFILPPNYNFTFEEIAEFAHRYDDLSFLKDKIIFATPHQKSDFEYNLYAANTVVYSRTNMAEFKSIPKPVFELFRTGEVPEGCKIEAIEPFRSETKNISFEKKCSYIPYFCGFKKPETHEYFKEFYMPLNSSHPIENDFREPKLSFTYTDINNNETYHYDNEITLTQIADQDKKFILPPNYKITREEFLNIYSSKETLSCLNDKIFFASPSQSFYFQECAEKFKREFSIQGLETGVLLPPQIFRFIKTGEISKDCDIEILEDKPIDEIMSSTTPQLSSIQKLIRSMQPEETHNAGDNVLNKTETLSVPTSSDEIEPR